MKKIDLSKVKTERELRIALKDLDVRWQAILRIQDPKKKAREILKIKQEIRYMLNEFKRQNLLSDAEDSNINLCSRMFRNMIAWFKGTEKKYKDV
jgi:hypothetical protein